jgi:hypothetical protein
LTRFLLHAAQATLFGRLSGPRCAPKAKPHGGFALGSERIGRGESGYL